MTKEKTCVRCDRSASKIGLKWKVRWPKELVDREEGAMGDRKVEKMLLCFRFAVLGWITVCLL